MRISSDTLSRRCPFVLTKNQEGVHSVDKKSSMFNRYYRELYQKYYGSGNQFYLFVISGCLLSAIFCLILVLILLLIICFEWFIDTASNSVIDSSLSNAIQRSNKISLTKNIALPEQNIETTVAATKFENGNGKRYNMRLAWAQLYQTATVRFSSR